MELEEVLVSESLVTRDEIGRLRERSRELRTPMVKLLVDEEVVAEDVLADLLARSVGTVVIDMEQGELDLESVRLVPGTVARRYLLLPIMPDPGGSSLRVAFADPLDPEAIAMVTDLTGFGVSPLVATVSGVLAAIEKFHGRDTRVIRGVARSEIPPEITRRMESHRRMTDALSGTSTSPAHRMEHDATMEQKHEALLLALIEAGVLTRDDYIRALRRLLGKE